MKTSFLKAAGFAAAAALACVGCTDSGVSTGKEADVFLDRVDGTTYPLSVTINPYGGGSVSRNPNKGSYIPGEKANVTATPNSGYAFINWSGASTATTNAVSIEMDGPKSLTANFKRTYTLNVYTDPYNGGTVSRNPTNSSGLSSGVYLDGTQVTVTATAQSGYVFTGWSGASTSANNTIYITMDSHKDLTANFKRTYTLTVNTNPSTGAGSVSRSPTNSSGLSSGVYLDGAQVTLTASAQSGYAFTGWSDGSTANPRTITMSGNTTLTANFKRTYTLTVNTNPSSGGTVSRNPDSSVYVEGTQVTLTATANQGYKFTGWSGASSSTSGTIYITMDGTKTLTANFQQQYTLTFNANGATSGTAPSAITVDAGSGTTLPYQGTLSRTCHTFGGWTDDMGNTYTAGSSYRPDRNVTLRAKWDVLEYTVTFNRNDGSGNIYSRQSVECGSAVTLPVYNDSRNGYRFVGWSASSSGGTVLQPGAQTGALSGNAAYYAVWVSVYTVTFNANGATGTPPSAITVDANSSVTLPNEGGLIYSGRTFARWNTSSAGTGTSYSAGSSYTPSGGSNNIVTLYAIWEALGSSEP